MTIPFFRPLSSTLATFEGLTNEGATTDAILHTLTRLQGTCGSYSLRVDAVNVNLAAVRRNPVVSPLRCRTALLVASQLTMRSSTSKPTPHLSGSKVER
jgi:hypothetical protein